MVSPNSIELNLMVSVLSPVWIGLPSVGQLIRMSGIKPKQYRHEALSKRDHPKEYAWVGSLER